MPTESQLLQIWIKRAHRGPMDNREQARLLAHQGLVDCANQGGKRQVTILSEEAWKDAERDLGESVDPVARRANLLVRGIDLEDSRNRVLRIGSARILVHGETRPCERMEEACRGLREALSPHWRAGAYGEVLNDAVIRIGDAVDWEETRAAKPARNC